MILCVKCILRYEQKKFFEKINFDFHNNAIYNLRNENLRKWLNAWTLHNFRRTIKKEKWRGSKKAHQRFPDVVDSLVDALISRCRITKPPMCKLWWTKSLNAKDFCSPSFLVNVSPHPLENVKTELTNHCNSYYIARQKLFQEVFVKRFKKDIRIWGILERGCLF